MSVFFVGQEGVKTRDGRDVRILCVDAPGDYSIVALVGDGVFRLLGDGNYSNTRISACDLILPKRIVKHTIWVNVWATAIRPYFSEQQAINEASDSLQCLKVAHPITIEVEV